MKTIKIALMSCVVLFGFSLASHAYDIVQVTNTPGVNEGGYSIAIHGDTVYAVWVSGNEPYFDKSTDLGKTWGVYRKIIEGIRYTNKIFVAKNGRIFIPCYMLGGYTVLKVSDDDGNTFYNLELPEGFSNIKFAINKTGNIIYEIGYSPILNKYIITKSFDGGETFSIPKEISISPETFEISDDGKYVYIFYIGTIYIEGYPKTVPFFTRSTDYGETLEEPRPLFRGHHWTYALDSDISENGEVYLAFQHDSYGNNSVQFLKSTDNGISFLGSRISDGWELGAFDPSIAVDKRGIVYATFRKGGIYFDKGVQSSIGQINFGIDKEIDTAGMNPIIAVTREGDKACIMRARYNISNWTDLYSTTFATNEPPKIDPPIGSREVNEGSLLDFTVSATDDDGDAITYSASNLPQGAIFNTQTNKFTWTPDYNQAGIYENIKFTVSDGVNITGETITITVNNTNRSPVINSIGNKSVNEGALLQFTVSATDPDSDTITYSMLNAPSGATINPQTGQFSWTPNYNQAGSYIITFVASDGNLSAGETITLKVDNVPIMPTLNPIGNKQVNKGALLEFTVSVAGPDADRVLYAVYLAGDLNHDNVLAPMDVLRIISTLNRYGPDITPARPGWNPEMDLTNDNHITSRDALIAINMLNKGMTTRPSGISIDDKSGRFSWRPTAAQVGEHRLTFVASDGSLSDAETIIITVKNGAGALRKTRIRAYRKWQWR